MDRDLPRLIVTVGPPTPAELRIADKLFTQHPEGDLILISPHSPMTGCFTVYHSLLNWNRINALFTKEAP